MSRSVSVNKRLAVLHRCGWTCYLCGRPLWCRRRHPHSPLKPAVDHVVPRGRGGTSAASNLMAACEPCRSAKGERPLEEFAPELWLALSSSVPDSTRRPAEPGWPRKKTRKGRQQARKAASSREGGFAPRPLAPAAVVAPAPAGAKVTRRERRLEVFRRCGWQCYLCRRPLRRPGAPRPRSGLAPTVDHVVPVSRGGPSTPDNLMAACPRCNQCKGSRRLDELTREFFDALPPDGFDSAGRRVIIDRPAKGAGANPDREGLP